MENKELEEQLNNLNPRGYKFIIQGKAASFLDIFEGMKNDIVYNGAGIITIDFFVKAITDSACNIDAAFNRMMEEENFLCAIPFIRMQLDNAMMAWAGLICTNDVKFFTSFASGEPVNHSHFSWESLKAQGITKEMVDKKGIRYDSKKQMTTKMLSETLNLKNDGFTEMYRKACTYVHPSASLLKASWFTPEKGVIKAKGWEEAMPYNYGEGEIVTDYINACRSLYYILLEWKKLKAINSEIYTRINNGEPLPEGVDINPSEASEEDLKKLLKVLKNEDGSTPDN